MRVNLICLLTGTLVFSNALATEEFVCRTSKHTAIVDRLPSGDFQYRVWNRPKPPTDKPDMVVVSGKRFTEGTGVCRYRGWEFDNGKVQYLISTPVACTEEIPPANASGRLSVFIAGEHRKSWWCLESPGGGDPARS